MRMCNQCEFCWRNKQVGEFCVFYRPQNYKTVKIVGILNSNKMLKMFNTNIFIFVK